MFSKVFSSLGDNILKKTTNPFLGTFILVWVVHNWKFVYSLFYFDSFYTLEMKLEKIESYFLNYGIGDTLITILVAIAILASTYILLNISRLIVNFFEKKVTPLVYQITDKSSVVLKSDYVIMQKQAESLDLKVQEERELKLKAQNEISDLENRIAEILSKDPLDIVSKEVEEKPSHLFQEPSKADFLFDLIIKEGRDKDFDQLAGSIKNDDIFDRNNGSIQYFNKIGMIEKTGRGSMSGTSTYKLTNDGEKVLEKILRSKL